MRSHKKNGLKNILMQKAGKSCNQGTQREQLNWSVAEEQEKRGVLTEYLCKWEY